MSRLDPRLLLQGYATGIFPMADSREADELFWVEPRNRAIIPLDHFHMSRSLRGTIDDLPEKSLPPVRKFQQKPTGNLTGTMQAFRPDGALGSGKLRPASTGDYEPWIPE